MVQGYVRSRLAAGYDPKYLQQLFDFIVYIISSLEAPARSESTKKVSFAISLYLAAMTGGTGWSCTACHFL